MSDETPGASESELPGGDEAGFDELARRAGAALRRPAPEDGVRAIAQRHRRQQAVRATVVAGVVVAALVGTLAVAADLHEPDSLTPVDSPPATLPVTSATTSTSSTRPWTVDDLNQAIGPAATAWLQSGGAGDSPEAFALREAAREVVLTLDDRALPDSLLKDPDSAWPAEYHLELLAGCSTSAGTKSAVCQDYPTISQMHAYRTLASLKFDLPDLGTLLFAGSYVVGDSIQPGRYETIWPVENCQWTTRDADDGINDGGYFESEQQLEMIVRSSDFAVLVVPECGVWRLAD